MLPIFVDIHEPALISAYLGKTCHVISYNCEPQGYADYWWNNGSVVTTWERKKSRELLSVLSGRIDTQLQKYKAARPDAQVGILQEGLITPDVETGGCQLWKYEVYTNGQQNLEPGKVVPFKYISYISWIYARMREGFHFMVTHDEMSTAWALSAMMYNDMKSTHTGLRRHVKIKVRKENPYISHLMSIKGIGEKKATELLEEFDTPWDIYKLPEGVVAEIFTHQIARQVMGGIGKPE